MSLQVSISEAMTAQCAPPPSEPAKSAFLRFSLGQHQLQPFDFQAADGHFALRQQFALRKHHRVRSGNVGGKRIGGRRHDDDTTIFAAKNPARFPS
jgi:hypothetical protein